MTPVEEPRPASEERSVWERCWCWQVGRCLVDCPTADHLRPRPFTTDAWRDAALALQYPIGAAP